MKEEYDFYFVMSQIAIGYPTGGMKIIYKLAQKLAERNYNVAIHFLTDPFRVPRILFSDINKIRNSGFLQYHIKNFMNNQFSFKYIIPNIRKLIGVKYKDSFPGVNVYFSKNLPYGVTSKKYFATDYVTAFFVAYEIKSTEKYFISQHDESDHTYLNNLSWLGKQSYNLGLNLVVINDDMMKMYSEKKPVLFHVGIDDSFFNSPTLLKKPSDARILIPLRVGEMKGASIGIEAAKLIYQNINNIKIYAFGNYSKDKVPSFIDYYYLPSDDKIMELYRKSTIFVLPSILEGMSLPPLEAMASGCTVVFSDCIGIRVYLKHEFNSLIVPVRDPRALFNAVHRLLLDRDLMDKLNKNGIMTASKYSYDKMADEFLCAIDKAEKAN